VAISCHSKNLVDRQQRVELRSPFARKALNMPAPQTSVATSAAHHQDLALPYR